MYLKGFRVVTSVATLFFFITCTTKTKTWKFDDVHSLDVRLLENREWLQKTKLDLKNLNKLMQPQLNYYLKKDFRIHKKLKKAYDGMKIDVRYIDSTYKSMSKLLRKMKSTSSDSLDDFPKDTSVSYRNLFSDSREMIKKRMKSYKKNIKKLKKAFKSTKQILVFVEEECLPFKKSIYELQYRRKLEEKNIERFNKKLNVAFFNNSNSLNDINIISISKKLESYKSKLNSFENFLINMEEILIEEMGGSVVLIPKKNMPPKFVQRYNKGKKEYLEILEETRKLIDSI